MGSNDESYPFEAKGYTGLPMDQAVEELVELVEAIKHDPCAERFAEAFERLVALSKTEGAQWVASGGAMRGLNDYILMLESDLARSTNAISYWQDRALKMESTLSAKPGPHGGH